MASVGLPISTSCNAPKKPLMARRLSFFGRSMKLNLKSSVVSLEPSWNVTSSRSTMPSRMFLSSSQRQLLTSAGCSFRSPSMKSGESKTALYSDCPAGKVTEVGSQEGTSTGYAIFSSSGAGADLSACAHAADAASPPHINKRQDASVLPNHRTQQASIMNGLRYRNRCGSARTSPRANSILFVI
ncbi:hypothetical protein D3C85_912750 [compost metagenome]